MALLGKPLKGEASAEGGGGQASQQRGRAAAGSQAEREHMEKLAKEDLQRRLAAATRKQLKVRRRRGRSKSGEWSLRSFWNPCCAKPTAHLAIFAV